MSSFPINPAAALNLPTQMPSDPSGGYPPTPEGTPIPSGSGQPSIWRRILAGGLLGTAAGLAHSNKPWEAPQAAVGAVLSEDERQKQDQARDDEEQRRNQETQLHQQQVEIEQKQADTQGKLADANAALALTHKILLEKQIQQLPLEEKQKKLEMFQSMTNAYKNAGLSMVTEIDDNPDARASYLQSLKQQGNKITDFIFSPDPSSDKIAVFQRDDSKILDKKTASDLSKSTGIKIPEGTPVHIADVILSHEMQRQTEKEVAGIHADAQRDSAGIAANSRVESAEVRAESSEKKAETYGQLAQMEDKLIAADKAVRVAESAQSKESGFFTGDKRKGELKTNVDSARKTRDELQKSVDDLKGKLQSGGGSNATTRVKLSGKAQAILDKYRTPTPSQ
jgi:hypothetical protein